MKVLVLTEYPPSAAGLATQGELFCRGLGEIGVDVHPAHFESPQEKEWYYRWFQPDGRRSAEEIGREFSDLVINGLIPH